MQNRLVRSRGTTHYLVTCALRIETTENPKLSLLYVLILWSKNPTVFSWCSPGNNRASSSCHTVVLIPSCNHSFCSHCITDNSLRDLSVRCRYCMSLVPIIRPFTMSESCPCTSPGPAVLRSLPDKIQ